MKKDIETPEDIKLMVDTFYNKVKQDGLIGPIFNEKAQVRWADHLPKMYKFWGTQLIGTGDYVGRPFPPHIPLDLQEKHFQRWLQLFFETIDDLFEGPVADIAKNKGASIASIFQYKLETFKNL